MLSTNSPSLLLENILEHGDLMLENTLTLGNLLLEIVLGQWVGNQRANSPVRVELSLVGAGLLGGLLNC